MRLMGDKQESHWVEEGLEKPGMGGSKQNELRVFTAKKLQR